MKNLHAKKLFIYIKRDLSSFISHLSFSKGYTLIELLAVIGILSIIGVIVVTVIFISLRGSQKTDKLEVIRQSGDAVLSQMVKNIRYAKTLNSPASCVPSTNVSSIVVTSLQDNGQTTYSCNANTLASNSAALIDNNAIAVSNCSFTCSQQRLNDAPTITIQFTLSARTASSFSETSASIPFQTSVTLRNFTR